MAPDPARELCRRSAHFFLFEAGLLTKDEHDPLRSVKPFPDKLHLRAMLDTMLVSGGVLPPERAVYFLVSCYEHPPDDPREALDYLWARNTPEAIQAGRVDAPLQAGWAQIRHLAVAGLDPIEKSRQIMATWLTAAYCLWRAKYLAHQLILWQSKREDDAANVVYDKDMETARISFMEAHLPRNLQDGIFPRGVSRCNIRYPNGSRIWGIPEGADIIRSNTPSVLVTDEAAFQPEFASARDAAMPAVKGGGQIVALSSAAPGAFAEWVGAEGA